LAAAGVCEESAKPTTMAGYGGEGAGVREQEMV